MSYLIEFKGNPELEELINKIKQKDEFKNCYLSPFESIQTKEWMDTN